MLKQTVGLTEVEIEYARPGVKDRSIFAADGLVPFGQIWRTGANTATTISFSDDVKLEGNDVAAGKYALYTIPNADEWTIMLYKDLTLGGNVANYKSDDELLRFKVKPQEMPMSIESFTIDIGDLSTSGEGTIGLLWDKTYVPIKLVADYRSKVMAEIDQKLKNPMATVAANYLGAGWFLSEEGDDLTTALDYMNKGLELTSSPFKYFWVNRKAMVQAKAGDYQGAIATAKEAHDLGKNAPENAKAFYEGTVKGQLEDNIAKWSKKM